MEVQTNKQTKQVMIGVLITDALAADIKEWTLSHSGWHLFPPNTQSRCGRFMTTQPELPFLTRDQTDTAGHPL